MFRLRRYTGCENRHKSARRSLMSHIREQRAKARKFLHGGRKRVQFTSLYVCVKLTLEIRHLQPLEKEGNGRECSRDEKKKRRYEEQSESVAPNEQP